MKILYNSSTSTTKHYPITGGGTQQILVTVELDGDWFTFIADNSTSKLHIVRIVNKFVTDSDQLYSGFNTEAIEDDEQFDYLYNWFDNKFNYQDKHKGNQIDE